MFLVQEYQFTLVKRLEPFIPGYLLQLFPAVKTRKIEPKNAWPVSVAGAWDRGRLRTPLFGPFQDDSMARVASDWPGRSSWSPVLSIHLALMVDLESFPADRGLADIARETAFFAAFLGRAAAAFLRTAFPGAAVFFVRAADVLAIVHLLIPCCFSEARTIYLSTLGRR